MRHPDGDGVLDGGSIAAGIYGALAAGSVLAVESAQRETYAETVAAALLAVVLLWLAHSYAELTSHRIEQAAPLSVRTLLATMSHEGSILLGAAIPVLAVLLGGALGARLTAAVTAGVWSSVATVVLLEVLAAWRARLSGGRFLAQVLLGALLGIGTLSLKLILH